MAAEVSGAERGLWGTESGSQVGHPEAEHFKPSDIRMNVKMHFGEVT